MELDVLIWLSLAAFVAGFIDTIAGGGGLITMPALLFSGLSPIQALGTGKLQGAICGFASVMHFAKTGHVDYAPIRKYLIYVCGGALLGGIIIQYISTDHLTKIIPFLLLGVFVYFLLPINKKPTPHSHTDLKKLRFLGPSIGFYDGFFGPGTGSIWTAVSIRFMKLPVRQAIMYTKLLNLASSATALIVFFFSGSVHILAAIFMGVGAYFGGIIGARFVIYRDSSLIRSVFYSFNVNCYSQHFLQILFLRFWNA